MKLSRRPPLLALFVIALCAGGSLWWSRYTAFRYLSGETGEFDPDTQFEHSAESIERLALFGCELVRMLAENDQRQVG